MFEDGFEVFDDFLGEDVRIGEIVGFFQAFISEPEDVEAGLVTVVANRKLGLLPFSPPKLAIAVYCPRKSPRASFCKRSGGPELPETEIKVAPTS